MTLELTKKLFQAISNQQETEALAYLEEGAFIDRTVSSNGVTGITALNLAAAKGLNELVKALINKGHVVNPMDSEGFTPFLDAALRGHHTVLETLYQHGTYVLTQTIKTRSTALHLAAQKGHLDCVRLLSKNSPELLSVTNEKGETPLNVAIVAQKEAVVSFFLNECNVTTLLNQATISGDYPLHQLVTMNMNDDLISKALDVGAMPSVPNSSMQTPSQLADSYQFAHQSALLRAREFPAFHLAANQEIAVAGAQLLSAQDLTAQMTDLKI
jgi:ankyrin repeat protein